MPFTVTIIRHAQTASNMASIIQGSTNSGELTDRGKQEATALGKFFDEEKETFTRVYSSDLDRCLKTIDIMKGQMKQDLPEADFMTELRERNYGDWEGESAKSGPYAEKVKEMKLAPHEHHKVDVPNGESYQDTCQRAMKFFRDEIIKMVDRLPDDANENILIVTHRVWILCFLEELLRQQGDFIIESFGEEHLTKFEVKNTCLTRFNIGKPGPSGKRTLQFTQWFDTQHYKYIADKLSETMKSLNL